MGTKFMTGILVAGLVASFGGLAFANSYSTSDSAVQTNMLSKTRIAGVANIAAKDVIFNFSKGATNQSSLKVALDELVTAGTISRSQADAVLTQFQQELPRKTMTKFASPEQGVNKSEQGTLVKIVDPLKTLIDKGTLTEAQAQAVRDKMYSITEQQREQEWQTSLNTLVNKGTITRDQATKILNFLSANDQMMQNIFDQVKKMNSQQKSQNLKQNLTEIKDPVSQMVDQGIITQQQADALKQTIPFLPKIVRLQKPSQQQIKANLDALAAKGTITQDQVGKIQTFLSVNDQKMQHIFDQTKDMSPEQTTQYFKQNQLEIKDSISQKGDQMSITFNPISQMIDQGIITQQQANAVKQALGAFPELPGKAINEAYYSGGNSVSIQN